MLLYVVQMTLLAGAAALALWRGGWPERSIALILVAWAIIDRSFHMLFTDAETYAVVDMWHFGGDLAGLALILAVALNADRIWPLWVCSLQLLAVSGHVLRLVDDDMFELVYAIFQRFPFWLAILLLIWGTAHRAWRIRNDRAEGTPGQARGPG